MHIVSLWYFYWIGQQWQEYVWANVSCLGKFSFLSWAILGILSIYPIDRSQNGNNEHIRLVISDRRQSRWRPTPWPPGQTERRKWNPFQVHMSWNLHGKWLQMVWNCHEFLTFPCRVPIYDSTGFEYLDEVGVGIRVRQIKICEHITSRHQRRVGGHGQLRQQQL